MTLRALRRNYTKGTLSEQNLTENPLDLFDTWLQEVIDSELPDPNAMTVATVSPAGVPSQRILLLKGRPEDSFVFFTHYTSDKGKHIEQNANVSLHFPWYLLERQVNVIGQVTKLSDEENDSYFAERPKESQLGALVSAQSRVLDSRETLVEAFESAKQAHKELSVKRPASWGGYKLKPLCIEFWQGGEHRLHDRFKYQRETFDGPWTVHRLNP